MGQTEAGRYLIVFFIYMVESKNERDPIPEHFKETEEAAEFWDTHNLGDYWDLTRKANFETKIQRQVFLAALEPELANKLADCAHKQGISTETLINLWLKEKLIALTQSQN